MRVPIRKPGKFTHLKPDPNLTREKYKELKDKLKRLKNISQPHASREVKRLALDGDFSENAAYSMAKGRLRGINQKILEIENHLKRAIIIEGDNNHTTVELGSRVTVEVNGIKKKFQILGSSETEPSAGVISHKSPIGSALIGRQVGYIAKVTLADRQVQYKIIKIE